MLFLCCLSCWPPLYFVQHKTIYLRFCLHLMAESGYKGDKWLHCGRMRVDQEQPVYTPSLAALPARPSAPLTADPVSCCPRTPARELRVSNTATSASSPEGGGHRAELLSLHPTIGESKKKLEDPPGLRGTGKDFHLHPNL